MGNRFGTTVIRGAAAILVAGIGVAGNASATLLDRGPDMVYDNVLNITWTRQAGDGVMRNWAAANAWAAGLVVDGLSGWRLPTMNLSSPTTAVQDCNTGTAAACAASGNELGFLFAFDLGGIFLSNKTGTQTAIGGQVLTGIQPFYWSSTVFDAASSWNFTFNTGARLVLPDTLSRFTWAVRSGDAVAAVPEPASLFLFGLGALGLALSRRRNS